MTSKRAALLLLLTFLAPMALAQSSYTTGFEPPTFALGDVNGQNGWGHLSNSPTDGFIEPVPAGSPAMFGTQSLAVRTRNVLNFGVTNHLFSPVVDPPAGETGSIIGAVPVPDPATHFAATLWVHTPPTPVISTRSDFRFAELNPASRGPAPTDGAHRYAQVRLFNSTNDAGGLVRVEIGWYRASGFTVATVAHLAWNEWYRFEYLIEIVDGTDGAEPNDRFSLTIFDLAGNQLGTACGSTWELGWKSGDFDKVTAARAINGFDFASLSGPNANLAAHIDELSMHTFDAEPLAVNVTGSTNVCAAGTTTLSATPTGGGAAALTSYTWRNESNAIVATTPTFDTGAGTYTVMVTDALCVSATSSPITVTELAPLAVTIDVGPVLTAAPTGGSGTITGYTWRDALSNIVATTPTFDAPPGTYTVTVIDATCGTAISPPVVITAAAAGDVPTATEVGLMVMGVLLVGVAVMRLK